MKDKLLSCILGAATLLLTPAMAMAQDDPMVDARLEGYTQPIKVSGGSTALTWLLLVGLGVLCFSVLFKSAKRTHLD